ncbi:MAG: hypothetical protein SFV52_12705 [Saprospiraceae bacterium]|nr:hypothetical protein [Saprospiraceae bacterium]
MKIRCFLSACILLCSAPAAWAQLFVEGIRLTENNTSQYIEVVPLRTQESRFHVVVDYGQNHRARLSENDFLTDTEGRRLDFRSTTDALNYCYENGWELFEVYVFDDIRRFLLKRRL